MKQIGNLVFITVFIAGAGWFAASGYDLLKQEVSNYSEGTYGVLGEQMKSDEACRTEGTCSVLEPVGQDLQEINNTFQQVLGSSSDN